MGHAHSRKAAERERLRDQRAALAAGRAALAQERAALEAARGAVRADLERAEAARAEFEAHEPVEAQVVEGERDATGVAFRKPELPAGPDGAGLCFAAPVVVDGHTVIPVARVRTTRRGVRAEPVAVLDVGEGGARLERLADPGAGRRERLVSAVLGGLAGGLAALVVSRRPRATRRPRRPWRS